MKIDIHVHTRKCKTGDAPTREIEPDRFADIVLSTDVQILGITNHNVFDLKQFNEIEQAIENHIQVWPGVELDIMENGSRGHLLVIVSPKNAEEFNDAVLEITKAHDPDSFTTTIAETLKFFDKYGPLYVAHYKQKKPAMSDSAIDALIEGAENPSRVIKEVQNAISAGIYISHGYPSIYGSDVHDWDQYVETYAKDLPDLRLPVESFEHFCLLLEKDPTAINTLLDQKTSEVLELQPFEDDTVVKLKVYNDINVLFGSKGTGKSCILKAVSRHYCDKGIEANVFEPASDKLDDIFGVKRKDIDINLEPYGFNYCTDEIKALRRASEVDVTNLSNYEAFFLAKGSNRNAKKIRLKNIERQAETSLKTKFKSYDEPWDNVDWFIDFVESDEVVKNELKDSEYTQLIEILSALQARLYKGKWKFFKKWKSNRLLNSAIELFRREVQRKTGNPSKPTTTGFLDYARNRMAIELNVNEVARNIHRSIENQSQKIGSLGPNKGSLHFETEIIVQDGTITDSTLLCSSSVKKSTQKQFSKLIKKIRENVYHAKLFELIAKLNDIDHIDDIKTVYELLLFKRFFSLGNKPYEPSSGEESMVMLHRELEEEKDIYILDEPERSLGNEYINDVIVPLLKERARAGKRVLLSTHDANIAVRTLPYCSVYRTHDANGYQTYIGNPYINNLVCVSDPNLEKDWKQVSMKTLEGGKEAFGERGKIYGNN